MDAAPEHNPFDLEGQRERAEAAAEARLAADIVARGDLVWLLSGVRGRRIVRRQLQEAGVTLGSVSSSFNSNYGQMCFNEGLRVRGLQLFTRITALLASGELPLDHFQLLMNEKD